MNDLLTLTRKPLATGFSLFAKGFRPFFILAALHAAFMIPLWIVVHSGGLHTGEYFHNAPWHAHEMVFGYTTAVVAGFLLTAASNWTKRPTATGGLLAFLCLVWIAGRVAPWLGGHLPPIAIATISLAFLPLLGIILGRVIVAARSKRNYGILGIVGGLFAAQLVTHVGALKGDIIWEVTGPKVGVDLMIVLILVIGGRIIPAFTRNATKAEGIRSHVAVDRAAIALGVALTIADAFMVTGPLLGAVAAAAAVLSVVRMAHWGFGPALRVPLLWVLHLGYLFVPLGFALRALAAFVPQVGASTALHLLTAGAIGTLTLGMMVRVSRGHTGRPLVTGKVLTTAFVFVILAALVRVAGPLIGGAVATPSVHIASTLWALAFLMYLVRIAPSLLQARPDGRPG